ncbi:MAG: VOC family protein [Salinigranum sp.]
MAESAATLPASTHVGRTALTVTDLSEVVAFYRDVIGLELLDERADGATLGADGTPLLLLSEDADAPSRERSAAGLFHTAFRVPSRAALGDALRRIRDRWRLDGASDHLVSEALYLTDPEGNGVEVYRDRPRETWPAAEDGRVGMDTLPLDLDELESLAGGEATRAPPGTTVGHVHLEVTSLDAAREFYGGTLGLNLRQEFGASAAFLAADGYHHHVGLNVWNRRSAPADGRHRGLAWFELVVPDREALAAVRERFEDAGVSTRDVDGERVGGDGESAGGDGGRARVDGESAGRDRVGFEVRDPDGIALRLRAESS